MKVLLVEDELLAANRLRTLLHAYDDSIEVLASIDSIEAAVAYLKIRPAPDLLLMDIHLSDGHCFEIFRQIQVDCPVIFTTAFDQYALDAFKTLSIDYILKPVTQEALGTAINKFRRWTAQTNAIDYSQLTPQHASNYKRRFLGKVGQRLFFINQEEIAYFQADNKIVYLVDHEGNRYVIEYTLERLEQLLDPAEFFRMSRRYIIHIGAIQQVKPYHNNRLKIDLRGIQADEEGLVISRDRVTEFRQWAEA